MKHILLVEDDLTESRMYQRLFTVEGYTVTPIYSGVDCRRIAIEKKPDVILLDIMMPQRNGLEALRDLQLYEETKHIPVIIITNLADSHWEQEAYSLGAAKFVVKSNTENKKLLEIVDFVLKSTAAGTPKS